KLHINNQTHLYCFPPQRHLIRILLGALRWGDGSLTTKVRCLGNGGEHMSQGPVACVYVCMLLDVFFNPRPKSMWNCVRMPAVGLDQPHSAVHPLMECLIQAAAANTHHVGPRVLRAFAA